MRKDNEIQYINRKTIQVSERITIDAITSQLKISCKRVNKYLPDLVFKNGHYVIAIKISYFKRLSSNIKKPLKIK